MEDSFLINHAPWATSLGSNSMRSLGVMVYTGVTVEESGSDAGFCGIRHIFSYQETNGWVQYRWKDMYRYMYRYMYTDSYM